MRRLAAIMFTDIVGYSLMMSRDEEQGMVLLQEHDRILSALIGDHEGTVLKKMGDAFLVEFGSAVDAVTCAVAIQQALKDHNDSLPKEEHIVIRIGIHVGDVMVQGDDLFGEGINVAARLEPLAPAGGICLSQAVYQAVRSHSKVSAIRIGEVELKNIVEKYIIYKIPSLYGEEQNGDQAFDPPAGLLDFKIKRFEKLPPPSRSPKTMAWVFSAVVLLGIVATFTIASILRLSITFGFLPVDFENWPGLVEKVRQPADPYARQVREMFRPETLGLVEEYARTNVISDSLRRFLRDDLNRAIRKDQLVFTEDLRVSLLLPDKVRGEIAIQPRGRKLQRVNRLLLSYAFPDELAREPRSLIVQEIEIYKVMWREAPGIFFGLMIFQLALIPLGIIGAIYFYALSTLRVRFNDVREPDKVLAYFIEQMGFRPPIKVRGNLVFKPALATVIKWLILYWWPPSKIQVRVDGNSVLITGSISYLRRLRKRMRAFAAV